MELFINNCDPGAGNHKREFFLFFVTAALQVKSLLAVPH